MFNFEDYTNESLDDYSVMKRNKKYIECIEYLDEYQDNFEVEQSLLDIYNIMENEEHSNKFENKSNISQDNFDNFKDEHIEKEFEKYIFQDMLEERQNFWDNSDKDSIGKNILQDNFKDSQNYSDNFNKNENEKNISQDTFKDRQNYCNFNKDENGKNFYNDKSNYNNDNN